MQLCTVTIDGIDVQMLVVKDVDPDNSRVSVIVNLYCVIINIIIIIIDIDSTSLLSITTSSFRNHYRVLFSFFPTYRNRQDYWLQTSLSLSDIRIIKVISISRCRSMFWSRLSLIFLYLFAHPFLFSRETR